MRRAPRADRRLRLLPVAVAIVAFVFATTAVLRGDGPDPGQPLVPAPPHGSDSLAIPDPYAYDPDKEGEFAQLAAEGTSHVLYERSPDGAAITAARVARFRPIVEAAARDAGVSADSLEGLVFLESAGRPDAMAGDTSGAVGLTQILAETGQNLLGMHIDLDESARLTRKIGRARERGRDVSRLERKRREVDDRYDPAKALEGAARYLKFARSSLGGREDLAFVSYHMGIGNLQGVLRAYGDPSASYARLYFEANPANHPEVVRKLMSFGDDSSNYLWKIYAAREIMRLYRDDPGELSRLEALHGAKGSAEEVLHPRATTTAFETPAALQQAWNDGAVQAFPDDPALTGLLRERSMGELSGRLGQDPSLYRGLRPEALAMALYIGAEVRSYAHGDAPLRVTSTVRDETYQQLLVRRNLEATRHFSLHTTGYAFDIARMYKTGRQAIAFQYVLDRLQALNVIAWVREPEAIHVTVGAGAKPLLPLLERLGG